MKKIIFSFLILLINNNSYTSNNIKNSGFYGVYVKSLPFWKFWNRYKAINLISERTQTNDVYSNIKMKLPILLTWEHQKAQFLKTDLENLGCILEVKEMDFIVDSEDDENEVQALAQLNKSHELLNDKLSKNPPSNLNDARRAYIEILENKLNNKHSD